MGREVRRIAPGWQHPKDELGDYVPMYEWFPYCPEEVAEGLEAGWLDASEPYHGVDVMPDWPPEERTFVAYYENTTEGTPLSPSFASVEELAAWCSSNLEWDSREPRASVETWLEDLVAEALRWTEREAVYRPFQPARSS